MFSNQYGPLTKHFFFLFFLLFSSFLFFLFFFLFLLFFYVRHSVVLIAERKEIIAVR